MKNAILSRILTFITDTAPSTLSTRHRVDFILGVLMCCVILVLSVGSSHAASSDSESESRWDSLKSQLFDERNIIVDAGIIQIDAPARAFDAARVPITLRTLKPQTESSYIAKLYLVVDQNPVPVAATFNFEPNKGWDTINTELRVNEYSEIRVLAELNTGEVHMAHSFIKAVGGCSAPPSSYERSDKNNLGRFNGGVDRFLNPSQPAAARFRLSHPNASGMQFDQFTRTYIPPHYIHTIKATFNGKALFTVDTNFSLSQDPVLGFNFIPESDGELSIEAIDSKSQTYEESWVLAGAQQ